MIHMFKYQVQFSFTSKNFYQIDNMIMFELLPNQLRTFYEYLEHSNLSQRSLSDLKVIFTLFEFFDSDNLARFFVFTFHNEPIGAFSNGSDLVIAFHLENNAADQKGE